MAAAVEICRSKMLEGAAIETRGKVILGTVKGDLHEIGKNIVKLVANDNFPDMTLSKRHYIGSGDVWLGSDLIKTSLGKGTIWLNTMKLVPNLGKDPVADIILLHLIEHVSLD